MIDKITFNSENKKGKYGEELVIKYLKATNISYEDVRLEKEYQKIDVDFLVGPRNRKWEVKTDTIMNSTGNIVLETHIEQNGVCNPGYWGVTEADVLIYVDAVAEIVYGATIEEIKADLATFNPRQTKTTKNDGGRLKTMHITLYPLERMRKLKSFSILWE